MKESGIYHNVYRDENNQLVGEQEEKNLLEKIFPIDELSITPESTLYAYTSIYSPAGINTTLKHIWEYKNGSEAWTEFNTVSFDLTGGRTGGFRWYSFAETFPGDWRVRTTTQHGQEIGVLFFEVRHTEITPPLQLEIL